MAANGILMRRFMYWDSALKTGLRLTHGAKIISTAPKCSASSVEKSGHLNCCDHIFGKSPKEAKRLYEELFQKMLSEANE